MRRFAALLAGLSFGVSTAAPSLLIPPEPLELVGIAQNAAPGQAGAPVTGIIAVRAYGGSVVNLYDAATARHRRMVQLPQDVLPRVQLAISPDGKWLAVALTPDPATHEGRVGILSTFPAYPPAYRVILKSPGLGGAINFAFSPDSTRLGVGNLASYTQLWDWQAGKRLNTVKSHYDPSWLSFSPDGRFFTPQFRGQTATQLLDGKTGELVNTLRGVGYGTFTPDGHYIASGGRYLSLPSGEEVPPPAYLKGGVTVQGYSRDGKRVLVALPFLASVTAPASPASTPPPASTAESPQGELRDVASGRVLARSTIGWGRVILLPDGRHILTGDRSGGFRLLDLLP